MEQIRQSRPDTGLGFKVKALQTFQVVTSSIGSGLTANIWAGCPPRRGRRSGAPTFGGARLIQPLSSEYETYNTFNSRF
jgi:hypothetical protein